MAFEAEAFTELCVLMSSLNLTGSTPPPPPWGLKSPTAADLLASIKDGGSLLPPAYQTGYVAPLKAQVPRLEHLVERFPGFGGSVETLFGAVQQHAAGYQHAQPLRRFLAVISDLYRSFLSDDKRSAAGVQLSELLPPLATFKYAGDSGPFTIPVDSVAQIFGATIGVVSMPAVYANHPFLWGSLAHETGGHDVVHADDGLLNELQAATLAAFGAKEIDKAAKLTADQFMGAIWAYWMDEAVADVYGLLNMGPAFAFNLVALFSGLLGDGKSSGPHLRVSSGAVDAQGKLDPHPTDILRLGLAMGVIDSLKGLAAGKRQAYLVSIQQLVDICAGSTKEVQIQGIVTLGSAHLPLNSSQPLKPMMAAARKVGNLIASTKLKALGGHGIQQIETWDNGDEQVAARIEAAFIGAQPLSGLGDDAQLLAGMTLALAEAPKRYAEFTALANAALDASYQNDPIFSAPAPDKAFMKFHDFKLDASLAIPVGSPARKRSAR
jgi:hypothetical protein